LKPAGFINPPAGSGLARYTKQALNWSDCTVSKQAVKCASVAAPLDYAAPNGQAITLKLVKVAATASPRLGTIFVNPGGPGEPGTTLAVDFQRTGLQQYDIVGWDPRGAGGSTPVQCENGAAVDQLMQLNQAPANATQKQALLDGWKAFGASCLAKSGALLQHISTVDTVQDLDMMRQLVGDAKLNYLGYSYGTYIGAVYAEKFAGTVGKLVLDSAVNITQDESVVQASGFDLALGNYADYCASKSCSLGTTKQQVLDTITKLLDKLATSPLPGDTTRKLTQSIATDGIAIFLYADSSFWGPADRGTAEGNRWRRALPAVLRRPATRPPDRRYVRHVVLRVPGHRVRRLPGRRHREGLLGLDLRPEEGADLRQVLRPQHHVRPVARTGRGAVRHHR